MNCSKASLLIIVIVIATVASLAAAQQQPHPDFLSALQNIDAGRYDLARTRLQRVVREEPENEAAWYYLGIAEYKRENFGEALKAFQQAEQLSPKQPGIRLYIGHIYEAQDALPEAISAYREEVFKSRGSQQAVALVALGRAEYRAGQLENAKHSLQRAAKMEYNYVEPMYYLGLVETARGQYSEAIDILKKAKEILTEWNDFQVRLQRLSPEEQRRRKQTEEQMAQKYAGAEHFAEELGMWPALNKALGDAYLEAGKYAAARNAYREAADRQQLGNPSDPDVYTRVARAYLADAQHLFLEKGTLFTCIGILQTAEEAVEEALEYNADYPPAHEALGEIYAFQAGTYASAPERGIISHSYDEAIGEFSQALDREPTYLRALLHMTRAQVEKAALLPAGQAEATICLQAARTAIEQGLSLAPRWADLYAELARVELAEENWQAALETAQHALHIDHSNVTALNAAGLACYYENNLADAVTYFSTAIEWAPKQHEAYINLANTFFQMQSWYRARREYNKALDRISTAKVSKTAYQRSYILYLIGLTYHETAMYDREIDTLNDALSWDPSYSAVYRQLARAHAAKEEYRAARRALRIALQQMPTDKQRADVQVQIGQVYEADNEAHNAVVAYGLALQLDPDNVVAAEAIKRLSQL